MFSIPVNQMGDKDTMVRLALITLIAMTTMTSQVTCETLKFDALSRVTPPTELRRKDVEVIDLKNSAILCLKDDCRELPYDKIRCTLEDHVYTVDEYKRLTKLPYVKNTSDVINRKTRQVISPCSLGISTDGDYCCPTIRYFTSFSQSLTLVSINNHICLVINLPGKFQCVTMAACCVGGTCSGNGRTCVLETSAQTLFVWNSNTGQISFEMFQFPAYCSCK